MTSKKELLAMIGGEPNNIGLTEPWLAIEYCVLLELINILDEWSFTDNSHVLSLLDKGFSSDYKFKIVTENKSFLLRCFTGKPKQQIEQEIDFTQYLLSHKFPVPSTIKSESGFIIDSPIGSWVLTEFVGGYVSETPHGLSDDELIQAARILAEMHKLSIQYVNQKPEVKKEIEHHLDKSYYSDFFHSLLNRFGQMDEFDCEDQLIQTVVKRKMQDLLLFSDEVNQSIAQLNKLIIHGDYHGSNMTWDNNKQVAAVFDWEYLMYWTRAAEVQATICMMCKTNLHNHFNAPVDFRRAALFFSAYQSVFPLSPEEIYYLPQIARLDAYRIEFELILKYINNDPRCEELLPKTYGEWFWWENHYHDYLAAICPE